MSVNSLSKGIFWYRKGEILPFLIPCDENGKIIGVSEYPIESKDETNYNHQKLWARLPRDVTDGVSFDFYPSGTVEISEGRSTVFLHPSLFTSEIELAIVQINLSCTRIRRPRRRKNRRLAGMEEKFLVRRSLFRFQRGERVSFEEV